MLHIIPDISKVNFKTIYEGENFSIDSVHCFNYIDKSFDRKPLCTVVRKHPLSFTLNKNRVPVSNLLFKIIHSNVDAEIYRKILMGLDISIASMIQPCILLESYTEDDPLLLITNKLSGTLFPMTNDFRFDVYSAVYSKFNKYQYMMKVNNSFKIQEYSRHGDTALVTDHHIYFNHVKGSIGYTKEEFRFDNSFYKRNKKLFDGTDRVPFGQFELFFTRDSRDYPR